MLACCAGKVGKRLLFQLFSSVCFLWKNYCHVLGTVILSLMSLSAEQWQQLRYDVTESCVCLFLKMRVGVVVDAFASSHHSETLHPSPHLMKSI